MCEVTFTPSAPAGRKRKADDDLQDDRMSASPSSSPNIASQPLPTSRPIKRPRSGAFGRPLSLPRLLETLDADSLRSVLKLICEHHPVIAAEVEKSAPRPSVASALSVLRNYETKLLESFPFGCNQSSDYSYNRVRQPLMALLNALNDFTQNFLPPNESQVPLSLSFLDSATDIIHRLPNWDSFQNTLHKQGAYEEMARAWVVVLQEAEKRAGGIQLQYDGWDKKLAKHNQLSNGKLQPAVNKLNSVLGWAGGPSAPQPPQTQAQARSDIRQELFSGSYGSNLGVRVGPW